MIVFGAAHAGPEVTFYLTLPLGGASKGHVLGLRLDRSTASPTVRSFMPDSPLNRRALLDLQFGADSAFRLELDRRLTWDINRLQWRDSSREATFNLRLPTRANPVQNQPGKPLMKSLAVEP
jgi:hypothetical protein